MTLATVSTLARRALPVLVAGLLLLWGGTAPAQTNDACSNPSVVPANGPFPYSVTVNTRNYADDAGDPTFSCKGGKQGPVGKTAWFTFTPSVTDNYRIDTAGTVSADVTAPYDTILLVNTGTCATLSPLANGCNDDVSGSLLASTSLALQAGTTYTIVVGGIGEVDFLTGQTKPTKGGDLKLTVSKVAISYPYKYYMPSVARASGVTLYVSDLNVTNQEGADGQFTVQFLGHGNDGDQNPPPSQPTLPNPIAISAMGTRQIADVVGSSSGFGLANDYGAILVQSTRKLLIGARTYTSAATGGTFGQFAPGVDASTEVLLPGEAGRLIGVRDDNTQAQKTGFRTNLVLVNTSETARLCPTQVEAHDGNGTLVGSASVGVAPSTMVQKTFRQLFPDAPALPMGALRVIVPTTSTGCSIGAVAYVIDNASQDPFAVALHK